MIVKGYRGCVKADDARALAERGIYLFNYLCVGCREHAEYSFNKASKLFEIGRNRAKNFHIEMMLILSGQRQIADAINLCGTESCEGVVAISKSEFELTLPRDDTLIDFKDKKLKHLNIDFTVKAHECEAFFENSAMGLVDR